MRGILSLVTALAVLALGREAPAQAVPPESGAGFSAINVQLGQLGQLSCVADDQR